MISRGELLWVLKRAYVPEHVVPLMESLSGGDAHILNGYSVLVGPDWIILVGYPLEPPGRGPQDVLDLLRSRFPGDVTWFIGPKVPRQLDRDCLERETDAYFRIDLGDIGPGQWSPPGRLEAVVRKASQRFRVQRADPFGSTHRGLTDSFLSTTELSPRVKELYLRLPFYLETQEGGGLLLSAWSAEVKSFLRILDLVSEQSPLGMMWRLEAKAAVSYLVGSVHFFPYRYSQGAGSSLGGSGHPHGGGTLGDPRPEGSGQKRTSRGWSDAISEPPSG